MGFCINNRKRALDLSLAVLAYFGIVPLMLIIAGLVRLLCGRPVFFKQIRPGMNGKPFQIVKFCTMTNGYDDAGCLLPDCDRLTGLGKVLRSMSLDELPEIFNVIKGEMSLVGPRPLLMRYLDRYTPQQARRHEVKPGLTGWAQVNGRNNINWEEKFIMDVWYVDHRSLKLDLKIIMMTLKQIFKREDINAENHATMPEFYQGVKGDR